MVTIIIAGVVFAFAGVTVGLYNHLARLRIKAREAQKGIRIQEDKKEALLPKFAQGASQENFEDYSEAITTIEKELEMAARYYNALVREYNTSLETFPSTLIAILLNFKKMEFHEAEQIAPNAQF